MISKGKLNEKSNPNPASKFRTWQSIGLTMAGSTMNRLGTSCEKFLVKPVGDLRVKTADKVKVALIQPRFGVNSSTHTKTTGLYNVLVKLRLKISQERGIAPYMVLTEQTLLQLAETRPTSVDNLNKIVGFNTTKINSFGADFISDIVKYCVEEDIETDRFETDDDVLDGVSDTAMVTYRMHESGKTADQIAAERGFQLFTILGHLASCLEKGGQVDIASYGVNSDMIAQVVEVISGPVINSDISRLAPIKEELMKVDREDIDWGCLKLVVAKLKTDFGVSDDGRRLRWTDETIKSYMKRGGVRSRLSQAHHLCLNSHPLVQLLRKIFSKTQIFQHQPLVQSLQ